MNVFWKISYFIILAGLFALAMFAAVDYQSLNAGVYLITAMLLAFLLLFSFFVGQSLSRPLKKIVKAADDLAEGNFQNRIDLTTKDEFGQLAGALNKIADELQKTHEEKEKIQYSVGQKVSSMVAPVHETLAALEQKVMHRTMDFHRANQLSEKLRIDLAFKEAELFDANEQLLKLKKRKSKNILS